MECLPQDSGSAKPRTNLCTVDHLVRFKKKLALRSELESQVIVKQKIFVLGEFAKVGHCFLVKVESPRRGDLGQYVNGCHGYW